MLFSLVILLFYRLFQKTNCRKSSEKLVNKLFRKFTTISK